MQDYCYILWNSLKIIDNRYGYHIWISAPPELEIIPLNIRLNMSRLKWMSAQILAITPNFPLDC